MWYSILKYGLVRPLVVLLFRPKVEGAENIPAAGAVILAANHNSSGETLMLPAMVKRQMTFPAKKELYEMPGIKGWFIKTFLTLVGQVPMDRSGGRASVNALGPIGEVLENGGMVGIFPEGSRSPDGRLYKGHTGVARLALQDGVCVVPVGLINTQWVRGRFGIPTMKYPRMVFGKPMSFAEYSDQQNSHQVLRWVTNEVMGAIQEILGNQYVDAYVNRVKYGDLKNQDLRKLMLDYPNADSEKPVITAELNGD